MNLRNQITTFLTFSVIVGLSSGCDSGSTGGTKPKEKNNPGAMGATDGSFSFGNLESVALTQGGSQVIDVSINRSANFKDKVKVSLQPTVPPNEVRGITFTPADWMFDSDESSLKVTAKASPDAPVGSFTWKVTAWSRSGKEITRTLNVVVTQ